VTPAVPFLDLEAGYRELQPSLDAAALRVLGSGRYVLGDEVEAFEQAWAAFCGVRHAVGVGNGLDALTLALRALGVGPGDEVVVPAHTFIATWLAVTALGAVPVGVDPDDTGNIDVERVADAIGPRTRAIVAVHLYGRPVDVDALAGLGVPVVEDAAQAHGAVLGGRRAGSLGRIAAFSFYPGKNLGAMGDAGAVTTDDPELAERVRLLRNYGSRRRYVHEVAGGNSRLDPLQAALLGVKLAHLEAWNARRAVHAAAYLAALDPDLVGLPAADGDGATSSWHLFVVRHPDREALRRHLAEHGVETLVHYPVPPHRSPAYATGAHHPGADAWASTVLSLPLGPHLTDAQREHVVAAVQASLKASRPATMTVA
jgi:dTDP-3-amino-3,4,6-trideoxy-alpha-D-glucose transaminase